MKYDELLARLGAWMGHKFAQANSEDMAYEGEGSVVEASPLFQEVKDALIEAGLALPDSRLEGKFPLVLYFGKDEDRQEFTDMCNSVLEGTVGPGQRAMMTTVEILCEMCLGGGRYGTGRCGPCGGHGKRTHIVRYSDLHRLPPLPECAVVTFAPRIAECSSTSEPPPPTPSS